MSQAQRKVTARCLPKLCVEGTAPARQASASGGRKAGAAVADLGEHGGGANGACAGQALEDEPVRVESELLGDLRLETVDTGEQAAQHLNEDQGDLRLCGGRGAVAASRRRLEATEQLDDRGAPGVGAGAQPGGETRLREPGGLGGGGEAFQEAEADRAVEVGEEADGAGEDELELGAQLVGGGDAVGHQVLAGPHRGAQREGGGRVRLERLPAVAVGAQAVREDEGITAVVLVAGQPVAGAQRTGPGNCSLEGVGTATDTTGLGPPSRGRARPVGDPVPVVMDPDGSFRPSGHAGSPLR
ncbi:MAG: hypothetical protein JWM18_1351 [Chloroflexi bacterium]|nr:hypothetical protein [Chloroflexota bacterium]